MTYPTRTIGKDNIPVSAIGFGAMPLSFLYGDVEQDEERLKVLDAVFESGCTFWDTANVYGDNEDLIGKWFKRTGKRDQIFLGTKFGFVGSELASLAVDGSARNVETSINQSLERLGVTYVDLYYLHLPDPKVPIEVTVGAMAKLVEQGKVKYIGLSGCSADTLCRASAIHPITALQIEYSPFNLDIEKNDVLNTARELGIKIVAYSPLGRGLLTGRYKSPEELEGEFRRNLPRFSAANFPEILKLVEGFQNIGKEYNATAGQVALAWLLAQGDDIILIPGTKTIKYVEENMAAGHIALAPEVVQKVRTLVEEAVWDGPQYPEWLSSLTTGDTPAYKPE